MITRQYGVNLVELMIALGISTVLLLMATTVMVQNRANYQPARDLARLNEGANVVIDMISQEIRQAGFLGQNSAFVQRNNINFANRIGDGNGSLSHATDQRHSLFYLTAAEGGAIEGYEWIDGDHKWLPSNNNPAEFDDGERLNDVVTPNTDAITIRGALGARNIMRLSAVMDSSASSINIDAASTLRKGPHAIFDHANIDLFFANVVGSTLEPTDNLSRKYPSVDTLLSASGVVPLNFSRYYVSDETGDTALMREYYDWNSDTVIRQPIMRGVENMQITYGEDGVGGTPLDGQPDNYLNADQVGNWRNIVTIKIGLLIRSETESTGLSGATDNIYDVNGTDVEINANDGYFRRVFHFTASINNAL